MGKHTLSKAEFLRQKSRIEELFQKGSYFYLYPFKIVFAPTSLSGAEIPEMRILISVPKRNLKRAVDRNRIKRLIRESYRLSPRDNHVAGLDVIFVYTQKTVPDFALIDKGVKGALNRLSKQKSNSVPLPPAPTSHKPASPDA